jgi:hypothetical protein
MKHSSTRGFQSRLVVVVMSFGLLGAFQQGKSTLPNGLGIPETPASSSGQVALVSIPTACEGYFAMHARCVASLAATPEKRVQLESYTRNRDFLTSIARGGAAGSRETALVAACERARNSLSEACPPMPGARP